MLNMLEYIDLDRLRKMLTTVLSLSPDKSENKHRLSGNKHRLSQIHGRT
jgi:hypothetical protein